MTASSDDAARHALQLYEEEFFLVDSLARFVGAGLGAGEAVVVIATEPHRRALESQLQAHGLSLSTARGEGRYVPLDAAETLAQLMGPDGPDDARFAEVVGGTIARAAARAPRVRAFGEMVALLWADGARDAALRLEQLWSELINQQGFSLLCAYPLVGFGHDDDGGDLQRVCGQHTLVIPAESYDPLSDHEMRLRAIAELQRRAQALEPAIAERRQTELVLAARDDMLRAVVDASPAAIVVVDTATTVHLWNPAAEQLFGWSADEVVGQPIPVAPPDLPGVRAAIDEGQRLSGAETSCVRRDGSTVAVAISAAPVAGVSADRSIVLVFDDLSDRKQAEQAKARIAAIVESSDDAIIGKTLEGVVTSWNRGAERIFGYSAAEMIGQPLARLVPQDRVDDVARILEVVGRGERIDHFETERIRKDGRRIDVSVSVSPIRDASGRIIGASKIARDVTERRRAERDKQKAARQLTTLHEVGQAISEQNSERVLQTITDAATDLSGAQFGAFFFNVEDERGGHYLPYTLSGAPREGFETFGTPRNTEIFAPTFAGHGVVRLADVRQDPRYGRNTPHGGLPRGHLPVTSYMAVPVVGRSGEVFGALFLGHAEPGVFSDDAERIVVALAAQAAIAIDNFRLYEAERQARAEAEQSNRAKDDFLAMLGHELRNPLSSVQNAILTATLDGTRRNRALEIARRGTDQLGRLVDDLLDVARISRGRIALREETVALSAVVELAIDGARPLFEERGVALTVSLPPRDLEVWGDSARLEQVVGNLLTNAAKYTEPGGRVSVTLEAEGTEAVLRVRDTGIGIAPPMLARVFDLFVQAEQALDRSQGGLGLGLTLVKKLIDLHGGRVEAYSAGIGEGAEFVVHLPAREAARKALVPAAAASPDRRAAARVLIVEDNADAAASMTMLLELLGHRVRMVGDGLSALEAARANPPDVMLVDIGLPGMNGYEVAERVREEASLRHVVLVALTGYGRDEDRKRALASGFDYHLVKPVDVQKFQNLVARLMPADESTVH